jgi:hypothetical protein
MIQSSPVYLRKKPLRASNAPNARAQHLASHVELICAWSTPMHICVELIKKRDARMTQTQDARLKAMRLNHCV